MRAPRIQWDNRLYGPDSEQERTLSEFLDGFEGPQGSKTAFISDEEDELIGGAARLFTSQVPGIVLPATRLNGTIRSLLMQAGFALESPSSARGPTRGSGDLETEISLLTSGTAGTPKLVTHRWGSLITVDELMGETPRRWLSTYLPGTYAWYQMVQMLLFVPQQDLILGAERSVTDLIEAAFEFDADSISATPTFWRMALLQFPKEELQQLSLQNITLGGEVVDQDLLYQLVRIYPQSTITHIYASTEQGASIVVHDRQAGFPQEWLNQPREGRPELKVENGTLWVRSPFSALGTDDWEDTGDAIEIHQGRVRILGRKSNAFVNVGGAKVSTARVSEVLLKHPAICWCRVYGKSAPLVGELVAADWVARPGSTQPSEAELSSFCKERLEEHMIPRIWRRLEQIPAAETLKSTLGGAS